MSILLVVDAACDLPATFVAERGIVVFPITVNVDGNLYEDSKDPEELKAFYADNLLTLEHKAETIAFSPEKIHQVFKDDILEFFDFALVQTASKARSPIFNNYELAQPKILKSYRGLGKSEKPFAMRVMNSANMFAGQGLLAAFTSDLIKAGKSRQEILKLSEAFKNKIYAYMLPPEVGYIRERAKTRGENSVGAVSAFFAKSMKIKPIIQFKNDDTVSVASVKGYRNAGNGLFEYAIKRIQKGLLCQYVVVSVAGDEADLMAFEQYPKMLAIAKENNVQVLSCVMGLSGGINLGPGAISLALAAEDHEFED